MWTAAKDLRAGGASDVAARTRVRGGRRARRADLGRAGRSARGRASSTSGAAIAVGRAVALALPLAVTGMMLGHTLSPLVLAAVFLAWYLVLRAVRGVVPPVARLGPLSEAAVGVLIAFASTMGVMYVFAATAIDPALFAVSALGVFGLTGLLEAVLERHAPAKHVLVIGTTASELGPDVVGSPGFTWSFVQLAGTSQVRAPDGSVVDLADYVLDEQPNLVVLPGRESANEVVDRLLGIRGVSFRLVSLDHFFECALGRVSARTVSPMWFMGLLHPYAHVYGPRTKRHFDVAVALVAMTCLWPLFGTVALLVRLSGPGRVLYRQTRVGEAGRPFQIVKFRTMVHGAETTSGAEWASKDDARVTRIGRRLRRYRLDELPQLWNVLRGEMSIVGPRPERPGFIRQLEHEVPYWSRRLLVKPGITGWAQVRHGYTADAMDAANKLAYDLYYIKHHSVVLDLVILLKTMGVVVRGSGAR